MPVIFTTFTHDGVEVVVRRAQVRRFWPGQDGAGAVLEFDDGVRQLVDQSLAEVWQRMERSVAPSAELKHVSADEGGEGCSSSS